VRRRSLVIGLAVSALFLYLAFRKTDLHEVTRNLAAANLWYLLPASALTIFAFWVRALRWGFLLRPLKSIRLGTLFSATMIGFMCNNLLPMRLGELVRAWVIGRSARIRASAALATIVVERLFDLFSMIAIFGGVLIFAPIRHRELKTLVLIGFVLGVVILGGLLVLHFRGARLGELFARFVPRGLRPRATSMLDSFQTGLGIFRRPGQLIVIGGLTFLMWFCFAGVIRICFAAARLETGGVTLAPAASFIVLVVIGIGIMVPSGPGFIGTMQAAGVFGLAIAGYGDKGRALSFSILYHITQWVPIVLVGLFYLTRENLSLAQVGHLAERAPLENDPGGSG
jgi:glycosyltransferase 2 family protein